MKNTIATPVLIKAKSTLGKDRFKANRYLITDVDIYEEEEMIKVRTIKKILNNPADQINKKLGK